MGAPNADFRSLNPPAPQNSEVSQTLEFSRPRALVCRYGLLSVGGASDDELDFIVHDDVKVRMGASAGEDGKE